MRNALIGHIALLFCLAVAASQPTASLAIMPSSLVVQEVTTYKFTIIISGDGSSTLLIPAGTAIIINFPSQYSSSVSIACPCNIVSWAVAGGPLSCSLNFGILQVSNPFTSDYTIAAEASDSFIFTVSSVPNPPSAQTILNPFKGSLTHNFVSLLAFQAQSSTFTTGVLTVSTSLSPSTTSSKSTMTISITPSHTLPANGCMQITLDRTYANAAQPSAAFLISQVPTCLSVANASANLYCNYNRTTNNIIVTVLNIFTSPSNSPFSFSLFPFNNPPTTQAYGSFTFLTLTQCPNGYSIDSSTNNKITGVTANSVTNPILYLADYQIGGTVEASISLTFTSALMATDIVLVTVPSQISCASVTAVSMAGTSNSGLTILNSTAFQFTSIAWNNPTVLNITFTSITLPSYAATITSPFFMTITRSNFGVTQMNQSFTISLSPGSISGSLSASNYQAGVLSNYTFSLTLQHSISSSSRIEFYFSPTSFTVSSVACISSSSSSCTVLSTTNNIVTVTSSTIVTTNSLSITLTGITNPSSIGTFPAVVISTYILVSGSYFLLDSSNTFAFFTVLSRPMSSFDLNISSTSARVYSLANFTVSIRNNNYLPANSCLWLVFPPAITITSVTCSLVCLVGTYNGSSGVQVQQLGPLSAATVSTIAIFNAINPISTQTTSSFTAYFLDSSNNVLEYLTSGSTYQASIPSLLTVSVSRSLQNSFVGWFNLSLSTTYQIPVSFSVILIAPSSVSCPSCLASSFNSTYTQMIFSGMTMTSGICSLSLANFTNFYSYEPVYYQAAIMSNDLLFGYANGSFSTINQNPSFPSFIYAFTNTQLQSSTDLIISNITSATTAQRVSMIQLTFGNDFSLSLLNCSNPGYSCLVNGMVVQLTVTNAGTLSSFSLQGIISPINAQSTAVSFATFSSTDHLIDQSAVIVWKASCVLPCKTCLVNSTSQCLSCYSDQVLAQSRVLYFASNMSCVSDCGDLYYRNQSTNICLSCSSSCSNCYNFSYCTSCPTGQYLLPANTTCFHACPTGFFQKSIYCIACTSSLNCYTCDNQLSCSSCFGRFYYQTQCLETCPSPSTVPNTVNRTCDACPTNCSTCSQLNNVTSCLTCSSGLLDNGTCVQSCITSGFVPNGLVCSACDSNCKSCSVNTTNCLSCYSTGAVYFLANKCYNNCPNTYYNNNDSFVCAPCTAPCETCYNYSSNACISCLASYTLFGTLCQSSCPSTLFINGTVCSPCVSPCLTCSSASLCFTCAVNYTLFSSNYTCLLQCPDSYASVNQTCLICSSNCQTCIAVTYCSSCHSDSYLLNGYCYKPCPASFYANANSSTCNTCPSSCTVCSSLTYCSSCASGFSLQSNNTCLSLCLSNQISISGLCQNCNVNCSVCQVTINNCTACISGMLFAPSQNSCYSSCPASLFYFPTNSTCLTSCPSPSFVQLNSTSNVSTCVSCPEYCTSCISNLQCGGCVSGTYSYSKLCYSSCPPAAPFAFNFACQSCNVVNCFTCSGTTCVLCSSSLLLVSGSQCITSCSSLQIYNSANQTCDTIVQNSSSSSNSTSTQTAINNVVNLNFIPMPFLIAYLIAAVIVALFHVKAKLAAIPTLLGLIGPIISIDIVVVVAIGLSSMPDSLVSQVGIFCLIATLVLCLFFAGLSIRLRYKLTQCQKIAIMLLAILHHNALALLTANIFLYNSYFIDGHRSFWRKYKFICKVGLLLFIPLLLSGIILTFSITDRSKYIFYSGIQLCILAFLQLLLTLAWIWLPLSPPPQETNSATASSEKSTEQMSDGHIQANSSYISHNDEKDSSMGKLQSNSVGKQQPTSQKKLRDIDTKSQGQPLQQSSVKSQGRVRSNYEFNEIKGVVKVNNEDIKQALERGLFRKDEQDILKEIKEEEEYSKIDDAQKLNDYLNKKEPDVINIFQDFAENELYEETAPRVATRENRRSKQNPSNVEVQQVQEVQEEDAQESNQQATPSIPQKSDGSMAMFQQPADIKEEDFHHNIIFQQDQQDNQTYFQGHTSSKPNTPNIFELQPTPSLGSLLQKDTLKVKVKNDSRLISPEFQSKRKIESAVLVEDFDAEPEEYKINVFGTGNNRIKPIASKQLSKAQPKKQIIHADFQEIMTVSDGGSLDIFEEEYVQHDSSRRLQSNPRINKNIHDHLDNQHQLFRPSEILRQASIHYQPEPQSNQAPKRPQQKPLPRFRSKR